MRMKSRRPLPPSSKTRPNQALLAIVLVVVGATVALGFERLAPLNSSAAPTGTAAATASPGDTIDPALTDPNASDAPSDSAEPSASPAAPVLQAAMPTSVNGTTLTIETDLGSTILGNDPGSRSFAAAVSTLGVSSDKLEIGFAYDSGGTLSLTVLGFRIEGVAAARLQPLVLQAWLSASAPGVTSTPVTLSGTPTTRVSYGDEGANEYVFTHKDIVFIVETADQTLATSAVAATIAVAPAASAPAASGAASPAASPGASVVASPAPSPSGS